MSFYERFKTLSKSVGKTPTSVGKELGFGNGTVSTWKNGTIPNGTMLLKLADYFGVSIDYLLGNEPKVFVTYDRDSGVLYDEESELFAAIEALKNRNIRRIVLKLARSSESDISKVSDMLEILRIGGSVTDA